MNILIRPETAADHTAIYDVTAAAFDGMPYADGDEPDVISRLRAAGALTLSLVALIDDAIVGQITFSPATAEDGSGRWFALGPVSVVPEQQGHGIGTQLIEQGLDTIKAISGAEAGAGTGVRGCILTGNPDYYRRFDFRPAPDNAPANEPAEYFMLHLFAGDPPVGSFAFHPAFYG